MLVVERTGVGMSRNWSLRLLLVALAALLLNTALVLGGPRIGWTGLLPGAVAALLLAVTLLALIAAGAFWLASPRRTGAGR